MSWFVFRAHLLTISMEALVAPPSSAHNVVRSVLTQISGGIFTPIASSFGWVAYSFNSLLLVIGAQKLMPESDFLCSIINGRNGYVRQNRSWNLGRILRDFDYFS
jgi:hypothetical protein